MYLTPYTQSRTENPHPTKPWPPTSPPSFTASAPPDLAPGDRPDPAQRQIDGDGHDADDPEDFCVVLVVVAEDDGEDDAAEVSRRAGDAGYDACPGGMRISLNRKKKKKKTGWGGKGRGVYKRREWGREKLTISMRMHMRHQPEIRPVARFQEASHAGDEPEHGVLVLRVREADGDEEDARDDGHAVDPHLLAPDAGVRVDEIADDAAQGAEDDVEEAEHGGPVAGARLPERGEVLLVVGAEDAVDGEFAAEGAEVAAAQDERLEGEDDGQGFAEGGFDDDLAARGVEHLLFAYLDFVREPSDLFGLDGLEAEFLLAAVAWAVGPCG